MSRTITRLSIAVVVAFALTVGTGVVAAGGGNHAYEGTKKVEVCHVPPGNPANAHLITVSKKGWKHGHRKHHGNDFRTYDRDWKQEQCLEYGRGIATGTTIVTTRKITIVTATTATTTTTTAETDHRAGASPTSNRGVRTPGGERLRTGGAPATVRTARWSSRGDSRRRDAVDP